MKITCAKRSRDEIIKDRDAYDANKKKIHDTYDEQYNKWSKALHDVYGKVKDEVEAQLANFDALNLEVNVSSGLSSGLEVRVGSNQHNVHSEHKALSWDYTANLTKEGEVKKETGSWSGLNAVTEEQLESLRQSVACLEILNSMDWASILSTPTPDSDDYITVHKYDVDKNRPNFEQELKEAEVDEAIQNGQWIKGHGYRYYNSGADVYYKVLKETPSQYEVIEAWANDVLRGEGDKTSSYKIRKDTFFQVINNPIEILEV